MLLSMTFVTEICRWVSRVWHVVPRRAQLRSALPGSSVLLGVQRVTALITLLAVWAGPAVAERPSASVRLSNSGRDTATAGLDGLSPTEVTSLTGIEPVAGFAEGEQVRLALGSVTITTRDGKPLFDADGRIKVRSAPAGSGRVLGRMLGAAGLVVEGLWIANQELNKAIPPQVVAHFGDRNHLIVDWQLGGAFYMATVEAGELTLTGAMVPMGRPGWLEAKSRDGEVIAHKPLVDRQAAWSVALSAIPTDMQRQLAEMPSVRVDRERHGLAENERVVALADGALFVVSKDAFRPLLRRSPKGAIPFENRQLFLKNEKDSGAPTVAPALVDTPEHDRTVAMPKGAKPPEEPKVTYTFRTETKEGGVEETYKVGSDGSRTLVARMTPRDATRPVSATVRRSGAGELGFRLRRGDPGYILRVNDGSDRPVREFQAITRDDGTLVFQLRSGDERFEKDVVLLLEGAEAGWFDHMDLPRGVGAAGFAIEVDGAPAWVRRLSPDGLRWQDRSVHPAIPGTGELRETIVHRAGDHGLMPGERQTLAEVLFAANQQLHARVNGVGEPRLEGNVVVLPLAGGVALQELRPDLRVAAAANGQVAVEGVPVPDLLFDPDDGSLVARIPPVTLNLSALPRFAHGAAPGPEPEASESGTFLVLNQSEPGAVHRVDWVSYPFEKVVGADGHARLVFNLEGDPETSRQGHRAQDRQRLLDAIEDPSSWIQAHLDRANEVQVKWGGETWTAQLGSTPEEAFTGGASEGAAPLLTAADGSQLQLVMNVTWAAENGSNHSIYHGPRHSGTVGTLGNDVVGSIIAHDPVKALNFIISDAPGRFKHNPEAVGAIVARALLRHDMGGRSEGGQARVTQTRITNAKFYASEEGKKQLMELIRRSPSSGRMPTEGEIRFAADVEDFVTVLTEFPSDKHEHWDTGPGGYVLPPAGADAEAIARLEQVRLTHPDLTRDEMETKFGPDGFILTPLTERKIARQRIVDRWGEDTAAKIEWIGRLATQIDTFSTSVMAPDKAFTALIGLGAEKAADGQSAFPGSGVASELSFLYGTRGFLENVVLKNGPLTEEELITHLSPDDRLRYRTNLILYEIVKELVEADPVGYGFVRTPNLVATPGIPPKYARQHALKLWQDARQILSERLPTPDQRAAVERIPWSLADLPPLFWQ